jgi:hypothetical protein
MTTINGFDETWVVAINLALMDRGDDERIMDITDECWENWIGPMVDAVSRDLTASDAAVTRLVARRPGAKA